MEDLHFMKPFKFIVKIADSKYIKFLHVLISALIITDKSKPSERLGRKANRPKSIG